MLVSIEGAQSHLLYWPWKWNIFPEFPSTPCVKNSPQNLRWISKLVDAPCSKFSYQQIHARWNTWDDFFHEAATFFWYVLERQQNLTLNISELPIFLKKHTESFFLGTFPLCIIMAWTGFTNSLLDCFFGVILASCASTSFSCPARPHVVAVLHTQLCFICFSDQFNYPSSPSRIALVASARRGRHQGPISRYPMNGWAKCTSCHWTSSKDHLRWNFNKTPIDQAGKLNAKQRTECFGQKVGSSVPKWFEVYTYATCNIM